MMGITTCLFIPKEKLYLIPFYDFYALRAETRAEAAIMKVARVQYKEKMKLLNFRIKWLN